VTNFKTFSTVSFVYSRLLRHKVGAGVPPGTLILEPDLAEQWEAVDDTTYVFSLRQGVRWHDKPPVNGRELVAEDVKFTFNRFLTEKMNVGRFLLDPVDRVEVVDRYTVQFLLKEPFVWLLDALAAATNMWIIAPEVVKHFGDLKKPEAAIGTGPFLLERYEPNVKTVFTRHPAYFRPGQPFVDRVEWVGARGRLNRTGPVPHWATRLRPVAPVVCTPTGPGRAQADPSPPAVPRFPR
jgi:peptide/nickel transport system substrate-binding protein